MVNDKLLKILEKIEKKVNYSKENFSKYTFFKIKNRNIYFEIIPLKKITPLPLNDLLCIENIKKIVYENTKKFISTGYANNVLLWGERGCGKSSLIKSIVNEFKNNGLKLIQFKKTDLRILEDVIEEIENLEYKFIIFLDDISFKENDDLFLELKSIMDSGAFEGNGNTLIYATSNRRHLIEERFISDDIIHENDAISEIISLSDRFGISLGFYKFNKDEYLEIVKNYAKKFNVYKKFNPQDALNFAMKQGGFTGRTALQYILTL